MADSVFRFRIGSIAASIRTEGEEFQGFFEAEESHRAFRMRSRLSPSIE